MVLGRMVVGALMACDQIRYTVSEVAAAPANDLFMTPSAPRPREELKCAWPVRLTIGSPHRADDANRI